MPELSQPHGILQPLNTNSSLSSTIIHSLSSTLLSAAASASASALPSALSTDPSTKAPFIVFDIALLRINQAGSAILYLLPKLSSLLFTITWYFAISFTSILALGIGWAIYSSGALNRTTKPRPIRPEFVRAPQSPPSPPSTPHQRIPQNGHAILGQLGVIGILAGVFGDGWYLQWSLMLFVVSITIGAIFSPRALEYEGYESGGEEIEMKEIVKKEVDDKFLLDGETDDEVYDGGKDVSGGIEKLGSGNEIPATPAPSLETMDLIDLKDGTTVKTVVKDILRTLKPKGKDASPVEIIKEDGSAIEKGFEQSLNAVVEKISSDSDEKELVVSNVILDERFPEIVALKGGENKKEVTTLI